MSRLIPDTPGENENLLDRIPGPYSHMRQKLRQLGSMVLPHPAMGFGLPEDEIKARKIIESIGTKDKSARVLRGTSVPIGGSEMAVAA